MGENIPIVYDIERQVQSAKIQYINTVMVYIRDRFVDMNDKTTKLETTFDLLKASQEKVRSEAKHLAKLYDVNNLE